MANIFKRFLIFVCGGSIALTLFGMGIISERQREATKHYHYLCFQVVSQHLEHDYEARVIMLLNANMEMEMDDLTTPGTNNAVEGWVCGRIF